MDLTITLSWWGLPLVVTIALFGWALLFPSQSRGGLYGWDLWPVVRTVVAVIVSSWAWLIWAVLT